MRGARSALAAGGVAFLVLAALVTVGATRAVDRAAAASAQSVASRTLDQLASIVTLLGAAEVTSVIALALAVVWWRHQGVRGLVPLLMFVGVGLELAMKFVVPQVGPSEDFLRTIHVVPFLHGLTPFTFPSGHVFRIAFLSTLLWPATGADWRLLLAVVVVAVMATRVYLGVHWLSDAVGGLFLGVAFGALAVELRGRARGFGEGL